VVPAVVTGRPLRDIERLGVALSVFHLVATDGADHELEIQLGELLVRELGDTVGTVDVVQRRPLVDWRRAAWTREASRGPVAPPDVPVERGGLGFRAREAEAIGSRVLPQWIDYQFVQLGQTRKHDI
jgi:hypothetical protein